MKRRLLFAFLFAFPTVVFAAPTQRYVVITRHPYATAVRALPTQDFSPGPRAAMRLRHFRAIDGFAADLTAGQVQRLDDSSEVEVIEPVVERHAMYDTVVPGQQTVPWGVTAVNAPQVWPVTRGQAVDGSGSIHVAVIDTGIDYNSPELKGVYKGGTNLVTGTSDPMDDNGHGTHVSGIIAAADMGKSAEGVVGVAPGVDLYAIKVLDSCGSGTSENIIAAIDWIIQKKQAIGGDWVANLSLGSDTPSTAEQTAFAQGSQAGILFYAAAGNSYDPLNPTTNLAYPAGYSTVESVGAIDNTDQVASFSQRGPGLKVVAPGVAVLSTFYTAEVATSDGQQFAATTPVVTDSQGNPTNNYCMPNPNTSGPYVFCNYGGSASDFPSSVKGKIALIERGPITNGFTFVTKILNAMTAGATGVIIFDHTANEPLVVPQLAPYSDASTVPNFPPTVFISNQDGLTLQSDANAAPATLKFGFETWALLDGTSMATPHATAVAALAWAAAPTATNTAVANAVENTATSLGDPNTYGHGLVNALAAAESLNPAAFGIGTTIPQTGRPMGRRGH